MKAVIDWITNNLTFLWISLCLLTVTAAGLYHIATWIIDDVNRRLDKVREKARGGK